MQNNWWMASMQEIQGYVDTKKNNQAFYKAIKALHGPIRNASCPAWNAAGALFIKDRDGILSPCAEHFNNLLN